MERPALDELEEAPRIVHIWVWPHWHTSSMPSQRQETDILVTSCEKSLRRPQPQEEANNHKQRLDLTSSDMDGWGVIENAMPMMMCGSDVPVPLPFLLAVLLLLVLKDSITC